LRVECWLCYSDAASKSAGSATPTPLPKMLEPVLVLGGAHVRHI
jgi:hypothetical protein